MKEWDGALCAGETRVWTRVWLNQGADDGGGGERWEEERGGGGGGEGAEGFFEVQRWWEATKVRRLSNCIHFTVSEKNSWKMTARGERPWSQLSFFFLRAYNWYSLERRFIWNVKFHTYTWVMQRQFRSVCSSAERERKKASAAGLQQVLVTVQLNKQMFSLFPSLRVRLGFSNFPRTSALRRPRFENSIQWESFFQPRDRRIGCPEREGWALRIFFPKHFLLRPTSASNHPLVKRPLLFLPAVWVIHTHTTSNVSPLFPISFLLKLSDSFTF